MLVVDSNVWIFSEDDNAAEHEAAAANVAELVKAGTEIGINPIILSEVYHALSRLLGRNDAARRVTNILDNPTVSWLEFTVDIAKQALALASKAQMRINDAMNAQQALHLNMGVLTDNVKDFGKVKGLNVVPLR